MYNLIEYSNNYLNPPGKLRQYYRDGISLDNNDIIMLLILLVLIIIVNRLSIN